MSPKEIISEEIIQEQAVQITKLAEKLDKQKGLNELYKSMQDSYYKLLKSVMEQLAVQSIVDSTHRERNENNREIVRRIQRELAREITSYPPFASEADIPF